MIINVLKDKACRKKMVILKDTLLFKKEIFPALIPVENLT
jgi:hypothetical protein